MSSSVTATHTSTARTPIFPSELRSPMTSSFSSLLHPMSSSSPSSSSSSTSSSSSSSSSTTSSHHSLSQPLKTPITPPSAYTEFLKNAATISGPHCGSSTPGLPPSHPDHLKAHMHTTVPLSPMYAAFLQQHFAHSVNVPPAAKARYRASVSGPSAGLTAPSTGPEGEARSPGLVMMGGVGMINGSRGNKMAVIEASKERARQLALEKARAAAGIKDQEREERQPGSAGSDSSVDSLSSGSTATPGSTGTLGGRTPDVKVRIVKPEDGDLEVLEEEEQDEKMVDENDDEEMEDADHTTNTCRRRKSVDMTGAEGIKSSTVTFPGPGGRITGPGMSLMPAPKGKRRRIE